MFRNGRLVDEAHFDIELREFRLTVGTQILVAETTHDLVVAIQPRHHQQLLENLRRLRQREEFARIGATWNDVVTSTFGRCTRQHRRLNINEAVGIEIVTHRDRDLVAQHQVAEHVLAAQIEITILEANILVGLLVVMERRRFGLDSESRAHAPALRLARCACSGSQCLPGAGAPALSP